MNETETVNLIKGTFAPEEAREILLELLNSQINFIIGKTGVPKNDLANRTQSPNKNWNISKKPEEL
ncbi:MAG: hypothetical protein LH614_18775 [Pyrinomonadaceae bacterium]|nr:hypothetical protein [Pyrinomonadaceae bacterium]